MCAIFFIKTLQKLNIIMLFINSFYVRNKGQIRNFFSALSVFGWMMCIVFNLKRLALESACFRKKNNFSINVHLGQKLNHDRLFQK